MGFTLTVEQAQELVPSVTIVRALPTSGQKAAFEVRRGGQRLALKIFDPAASVDRISREIRAMMLVDSPYVVKLMEFNSIVSRQHNVPYMLEEFVEGEQLGHWLDQGNVMSEDRLITVLRCLLIGLVAIWEHRLVHRDIKPGNIMLRKDGTPVLIDFGIARHLDLQSLTQTRAAVGPCTYPYAAPEQLRNDRELIDCRTDMYDLGLVAYQCVSGRHPYWIWEGDFQENLDRMLNAPPAEIPGLSHSMWRFLKRMLERPMHRRFPNPTVALERLNEIARER